MQSNRTNLKSTETDLRALLLEDVRFCVIDTETTGLDHQEDRVIEIAYVLTSLRDGVISYGSQLVNPHRSIPPGATAIHGIGDADVAEAVDLEEALGQIRTYPFDVWGAHNASFDFGFVPAGDIPVTCTLRLARRIWPELRDHKNQSLRAHWNLEVPEAEGLPAHRAGPDALVAAALLRLELKTVMELFPRIVTLGDFLDWISTPYLLPICIVGKQYRGRPWSEVPKSYMTWVLENFRDLDPDLLRTIQHHLAS